MTQAEFDALLTDGSKTVVGDIAWTEDEDHSPAVEFRAEVESTPGYPLFVKGSYNPVIGALSYVLVHRGAGRIYGLDLGKDHHNPSCQNVGEKHKHCWSDALRDKDAYVPGDITATTDHPEEVWGQFCREANIVHRGVFHPPPPFRGELL
jgi:hypothetical protein